MASFFKPADCTVPWPVPYLLDCGQVEVVVVVVGDHHDVDSAHNTRTGHQLGASVASRLSCVSGAGVVVPEPR